MGALYVVSTAGAGKTTICAGIGKYLTDNGRKVGFLKLTADNGDNGDTAFMKQVLGLTDNLATSCDTDKIREACTKVAQGIDTVIIEGTIGANPDDNLSQASYEIAGALDARVIIVEAYSGQPSPSQNSYEGFGGNLLGIILNKVPVSRLKRVQDEISNQPGMNVLGVLTEDRALSTLTIGELAECIQGKILNNAEKSNELVESVMLGAMVVDSGLDYFNRKSNKAAIIRGDRPDMQLAALETSTRCLVLSGSTAPPMYSVQQKAENRNIPIISTENDTTIIVMSIEDAMSKTRFSQEKKLPRLAEIMQHLNLQAVS